MQGGVKVREIAFNTGRLRSQLPPIGKNILYINSRHWFFSIHTFDIYSII